MIEVTIFLITLLQLTVKSFLIKQLVITPLPSTINTIAAYTFIYDRTQTPGGAGFTNYASQPVPSDGTIVVNFPSMYTLNSSLTCNSLIIDGISISGFTCSVSGTQVTVSNPFSSSGLNLYIASTTLILGNILNPYPVQDIIAGFSSYLGNDYASSQTISLTVGSLTSCSITFSPTIVSQLQTMLVALDPNTPISPLGSIVMKFPSNKWSNEPVLSSKTLGLTSTMVCTNQTTNILTSPTCVGSNSSLTLTISSIFISSTSAPFTFGVSSFLSPPTIQQSTNDSIVITTYQNGVLLETCSAIPSGLVANSFNSLTLQPITTMVVNRQVGLRFNLTLPAPIDQIDTITINFPSGFVINATNISGSGTYDATSNFTNALSSSGQLLTIKQRFTSTTSPKTYNANVVFVINYFTFTAPSSTRTTNPFTVTVNRYGFAKMTGTVTIQASASTLTGAVSPTITTASVSTSYRVNITTIDSISASGMLRITFPSEITIPTSPTNCASLLGLSGTPICSFNSSSNAITISSLNSTLVNLSPQTFQLTINGITNAASTSTTSSFTIQSYFTSDTTTLVATGTIPGITPTLGTILSSTVAVTASSYIVLDSSVSYTITFRNGITIPTNGYVYILIPTAITINPTNIPGNCKYSLNNASFSNSLCTATQITNFYQVNFTGVAPTAIPAATTIAVQIAGIITNPATTAVVSSFGITTYTSTGFAIQSLSTGISIQMTTPATFSTMQVSRLSNKNSQVTTYTITLQQLNAMEANAKLYITFPTQLTLSPSLTCTNLISVAVTCTLSSGTITVTNNVAYAAMAQFGVIVNLITNPPSYKPISTVFTFNTRTSDTNSRYSQGSFSYTQGNNQPTSFTSVIGTFSNFILNNPQSLTLKVTPSSTIIPSSISFYLNSQFVINSLSCSIQGFIGTCTINNYTVTIAGTLVSGQMTIILSGFSAPVSLPSIVYSSVVSFDAQGYKIDESTTNVAYSILCTLPCRTCNASNTSSCLSCYTSVVNSNIYLSSTTKTCVSSCPPTTYADGTTFLCTSCDSNCLYCSGASTNCTECNNATLFKYLNLVNNTGTCLQNCPQYYYPDTTQSPIKCVNCQTPCSTCTALNTCTSCLSPNFYNGTHCVSTCPSGTTIPNNSTNNCDACSNVCSACSIVTTNCTSCSNSSALYNGSCVSPCPFSLVIDNGICTTCNATCLTCSVTATNCTSCDISSLNKYLYANTCLSTCPQLYYPDNFSASCKACASLSINCANCSTSTVCLSCNTGYVLYNSSCLNYVPAGFVNITGIAVACAGNCSTCLVLTSNCTSCSNGSLDGNLCVDACPNGKVSQSQVCVACTNNCKTCFNIPSNCTSCLSNLSPEVFLSNFDCVTTCPNLTYRNFSNNECTACVAPCIECTAIQLCLSCTSGNYLFNQTCNPTCPFGYVGIGTICSTCTNNCQSCVNSTSICQTCNIGYYYISSTSSCSLTCPDGLYPNILTSTCTGCSYPCNTCSATASTCTSCLNATILLGSSCLTSCPQGYYQFNSQCLVCPAGCTACTSSTVCSACNATYYYYSQVCLSSCPSNFPVINSSGACVQCSDTHCSSCNSADYCTLCTYPYLLLSGQCYSTCPTSYTSNSTNCVYTPTTNTTNTTQVVLISTLSSSNIFPVPFTIGVVLIAIACIMSKFQHAGTFVAGSLLSVCSLLEWAALCLCIFMSYLRYGLCIEVYMLSGSLVGWYLLNFLALPIQASSLSYDSKFSKWGSKACNRCFYIGSSVVGVAISHRFKNMMFCKLFNLGIFKATLDDVERFKIFNAFAFLGFLPAGGTLFALALLVFRLRVIDQLMMAYIDLGVLTILGIVLAILNSLKPNDFFEEKTQDGVVFNKRVPDSETIINQAIMPKIFDDEEDHYLHGRQDTQLRLKLKYYSFQSYSEQSQQFKNMSIQAEPILESQFGQSKIDHLSHQQSIPELDYFQRMERSCQYENEMNDVSVNMTAKNINDISIQPSKISLKDISLQFVPNVVDGHVQINADQKSIGAQYSVKPIFEEVPQDFISDSQDDTEKSYYVRQTKPVSSQHRLKAEVQLDIDQKLKNREHELSQLQDKNKLIQKQKNIMKYNKSKHTIQDQQLNHIYNNQSIQEQSSLIESQNDLIANYHNYHQNRIKSANTEKDLIQMLTKNPSNKNQNQDYSKGSLSFNVSKDLDAMNFEEKKAEENLEIGNNIFQRRNSQQISDQDDQKVLKNQKNDQQIQKIMYEEQDKSKLSNQDISNNESGLVTQKNRSLIKNILKEDYSQEQLFNDKSGSTNFLQTTKGGAKYRPQMDTNQRDKQQLIESSKDMYSDGDDQILKNPIKPKNKPSNILPMTNNEGLDFDTRTNLAQFIMRRSKNNPVSAQFKKSQSKVTNQYQSPSQSKESRVLPSINRIKSQQSNNSQGRGEYLRMDSKKLILEGKISSKNRLQFGSADRIQIEPNYTEETQRKYQQLEKRLPFVSQSEKRFKSLNRSSQNPLQKEILRSASRKQGGFQSNKKYLEKQLKKEQNRKNQIQAMEYMLLRPTVESGKGYMKDTHASEEKKKSLEKVYPNRFNKYE